jgi:hypothetical protein
MELEHYNSLKKEVLQKYISHTFFETGTYLGDSVKLALEVGFKRIISIEIDPELQYKNLMNISTEGYDCHMTLATGDTLELMLYHTKDLTEQTTFWLDAHTDLGMQGKKKCPLYEEIEAIAQSQTKTHTIMIDDLRCFGIGLWGEGITIEGVKERILNINDQYKFCIEDGYEKQDILVAYI